MCANMALDVTNHPSLLTAASSSPRDLSRTSAAGAEFSYKSGYYAVASSTRLLALQLLGGILSEPETSR